MPERRLLLRDIDIPDIERIAAYRAGGGYRAAEKALIRMTPEEVIDEVARSGLREQKGAWRSLAEEWPGLQSRRPRYLCVEANESEPGLFRDRKLIERHPHQLVEGIVIAARGLGARTVYVCMREEMQRGRTLLACALEEAYESGFLGSDICGSGCDLDVYIHAGAGAHIAGEPTALLRSLEGRRPEPQPLGDGLTLFGAPAAVENAGTLAYLPHIVEEGGDWFRRIGTARYPGTCVFCVSGHVRRPGLYELELGKSSLRELVCDHAGGVRAGHRLKGVLAGGHGSPVLRPEQLDVPLAPEAWQVPGKGDFPGVFGGGGIIAMDETTCMVEAALNSMQFFARESCGQCPACASGTQWMSAILQRVEAGRGQAADLELLESLAGRIVPKPGRSALSLCAFGAIFPHSLHGFLQVFREEFERHVAEGRCPVEKDRGIKVPETVSVRF